MVLHGDKLKYCSELQTFWNEYKTHCIKIKDVWNQDWFVFMWCSSCCTARGAAVSRDLMFPALKVRRRRAEPALPQLSLRMQRGRIQNILARCWAWRVQSSTAREHVANWWRGGGCGIMKRAASETISPRVLFSLWRAVTSLSCSWNTWTGCQVGHQQKEQILPEMYWSIFKGGQEDFWLEDMTAEAFDVI